MVPRLGCTLEYLLELASGLPASSTPNEVLDLLIKPATKAQSCRFAELHQDKVSDVLWYS